MFSMKSPRIRLLIAAFLLGVVMLAVEIAIIKNAAVKKEMVKVLYTKTQIKQDTLITEDMVDFRDININLIHKFSIRDIGLISGKVAAVQLEEGEMLLSARLKNKEETELTKLLLPGFRTFTVEFKPDQANGWQLARGQPVDLLFIPEKRLMGDEQKNLEETLNAVNSRISCIKTVFPDAGIGNRIIISPDGIVRIKELKIAGIIDDKGKLAGKDEKTGLPKYVSFEVNSGIDEFIAWAKQNGTIEISSLRNN